MGCKLVIYVDIDNTICNTENSDYENSTPRQDQIDKINKLHDEGHEIIYWTARGTQTGIDWSNVTKKQFKEWGVKYHDLKFGKPYYCKLFYGNGTARLVKKSLWKNKGSGVLSDLGSHLLATCRFFFGTNLDRPFCPA